MPNVGQLINSHNKRILENNKRKDPDQQRECCRKKEKCPLKEVKKPCSTENIIYKAYVKTADETRTYIGLTSNSFKVRWYAHQDSFRKEDRKNSTALSSFIWDLKQNMQEYDIKWDIIKKIKKPKYGTKVCRLCITEVAEILKNKDNPLNKRKELMGVCRHRYKFSLRNWKKEKNKPVV